MRPLDFEPLKPSSKRALPSSGLNFLDEYKKTYQPGQVICTKGEPGDSFFMLEKGKLEVLGSDNDKPIAEITEHGEYFGELSVLLHTPRVATVRAVEESIIFRFPKSKIEALMEKSNAPLLTDLSLWSSRRLKDTTEMFRSLQELVNVREGLTQMIVHDLRNYLGIIMGHTQILEALAAKNNDEGEFQQKSLQTMLYSAKQMADMMESLLYIAKMEDGELVPDKKDFNLVELCKECVQSWDATLDNMEKNIKYVGPEDTVTVSADKALIDRVIHNLVGNAAKYIEKGGMITIELTPQDSGATLKIIDNGPGIPEELQDRVFKKFFQIKTEDNKEKTGVGLGLAFCKMAVDAHDGEINLHSKVGEGTTFEIKIDK